MADLSFLDWPFFNESHCKLGQDLDRWCAAALGSSSR